MKKVILFFFCLMVFRGYSTTWTINVSNFQFTPSTLNVTVGDVIHFVWITGSHTTTSTSVPPGAATWNHNMNISNTTYDYTVTVAGVYNYWCTIHAPGMAGSFTASSAVPVVLSSFDVVALRGKPQIKWSTATEINADHFSIRRSINGTDFSEIARVPATGNSTSIRTYIYNDVSSLSSSQFVYYSLGMVDKDGTMQLSSIKLYKNTLASRKIIISLSPNPVSSMGHLLLKFNADKPGIMMARLFDMQGKLLLSTELSADKGINNGHVHLGGIPAGNYTIRFTLDGISESYKISKQ
jgi:plastocyanin